MTATVYIANRNYSTWSLRAWILMRAAGIPFVEHLIPFGGDDFRSISPSGKLPCLRHNGLVIWDSLAIAEFLAERYEGVWPHDLIARSWARSAASEIHGGFTALREALPMNCGLRIEPPEPGPALAQDLNGIDILWREGLRRFGGPWLSGRSFTAADAFFAPVAFRFQTFGVRLSAEAIDYVDRLLKLPAMEEWYASALAEPWRDPAHEDQAQRAGRLISDLRVCTNVADDR